MKDRGLGRLFRPTYRDKKTGKKKRSRVLWIELWHHGNPVRFSSRTTNPKQAERVRKQRLAELVTGQFLGSAAERLTFEQLATTLLDDYRINGRKSIRRAEAAIKRLGEGFALSRAVEITADRVSGTSRPGSRPRRSRRPFRRSWRRLTGCLRWRFEPRS